MSIQGHIESGLDIYRTSEIRALDGETIADWFGDYTNERFERALEAEGGVQPLFIPARNEAEDLPGTLLAAANSEAFPVVLNNKSTDETVAIARSMGAMVVDVPEGNKMAATQAAYDIAAELGSHDLYFTDADTLILPKWVTGMRTKLEAADCGQGSAVFANLILWHGESVVTDFVCTAAKFARAAKRHLTSGPVEPRGANYAVRLDQDGRIAEAMHSLDPELFTWDDQAIKDTIENTGASVIATTSLSTLAISRNDHVSSLRQRFSRQYSRNRATQYAEQYGENAVYET